MVVDLGKIVEVGTHDELIDRGGVYYNLYTMQWKGQGDLPASCLNARDSNRCDGNRCR